MRFEIRGKDQFGDWVDARVDAESYEEAVKRAAELGVVAQVEPPRTQNAAKQPKKKKTNLQHLLEMFGYAIGALVGGSIVKIIVDGIMGGK